MAKHRGPRQSAIIRYGPEIAQLKNRMSPDAWHKLVKTAHKQGFTVKGALSGEPDALKERTRSSINRQAQRTVAASYKPVYQQLDARSSAIQALSKKQADDEATYRTWLANQADVIDAQGRAADAALAGQQQDIQNTNRDAWTAAMADSAARAAGMAGNVSNPQQSTALNSEAVAAQHSDELVQNQRETTANMLHVNADSRALSRSALIAGAAADQAKRIGDTWAALGKVASDRQSATFQQAADAAKMVQDLLGQEVQKAQTNQQTDIAAQELGVKRDSLAQQAAQAAARLKLDNKKFSLAAWTAQHKAATDQAKLQLGYEQIKASKGKAAADRALSKWLQKQRNRNASLDRAQRAKSGGSGSGGPTAGEKKDSNKMYQTIETIRDWLYQGVSKHGRTLAESRNSALAQGYSQPEVALALELRRSGGHLTPAARRMAINLGIVNPAQYWPRVARVPRTGGRSGTGAAGFPSGSGSGAH